MVRLLAVSTAVVLSSACVASATPGVKPALTLSSHSPLTVTGSHFHKGERVTVTFRSNGAKVTKRTTASASGSFTASADAAVIDKCGDMLLVRAQGITGDTASVKRQLPACPPPA